MLNPSHLSLFFLCKPISSYLLTPFLEAPGPGERKNLERQRGIENPALCMGLGPTYDVGILRSAWALDPHINGLGVPRIGLLPPRVSFWCVLFHVWKSAVSQYVVFCVARKYVKLVWYICWFSEFVGCVFILRRSLVVICCYLTGEEESGQHSTSPLLDLQDVPATAIVWPTECIEILLLNSSWNPWSSTQILKHRGIVQHEAWSRFEWFSPERRASTYHCGFGMCGRRDSQVNDVITQLSSKWNAQGWLNRC
jgi:hypothetical protein